MKRPKNKVIIAVLEKTGGLLKPASTKLNIDRATLYNWINDDIELQKALETIRESMLDMSEGQMYKLIQEGNGDMIKFHLKTRGKTRGYIEKSETDITTNGKSINEIKITWPDGD
jgi:hypothetical protein